VAHRVYGATVLAVKSGRLIEPFSRDDFRDACPGFGKGTYQRSWTSTRRAILAAPLNCFDVSLQIATPVFDPSSTVFDLVQLANPIGTGAKTARAIISLRRAAQLER